ncbi:tetratricopeptide repeat protein [Leptolyngbya sp. FACHB-261]|uniref:tetratricopeptide repeat protein n=1 Tax=Leptolyngbya sp. FACHB-261 TaxID=2692806 RepID=UPI001687B7E2|nr:tetratricopeptide repeat protein [Leptolyngbya sp. FACHB-261]MBD2101864.1 tetratricopeptide repeat protein [Leptolyngbya sp. FACHB-261]
MNQIAPQTYHLRVERQGSQYQVTLQTPHKTLEGVLAEPAELERLHELWRECYRNYYSLLESASLAAFTQNLYALNLDEYRTDLWEAETVQRQSFNQWLRQAGCAQVRDHLRHLATQQVGSSQTSQASQTSRPSSSRSTQPMLLALSLNDLLLQALPWEIWEVLRAPNGQPAFSVSRVLDNGQIPPAQSGPAPPSRLKSRPLRLLFVGDWDNLPQQIQARLYGQVYALKAEASLEQICRALRAPQGWDWLAWQTPESSCLTALKGVLGQALAEATQRGLRLALLNTADGLTAATSWLTAGPLQAVILQEPTPASVATVCLGALLANLLEGKTLLAALSQVRRTLEEQDLEYPVLHRVPTLFQHPTLAWEVGELAPDYPGRLVQTFRVEPVQIAPGDKVVLTVEAPQADALTLRFEPAGTLQRCPLPVHSQEFTFNETTRLKLVAQRQWANRTIEQVYSCQVLVQPQAQQAEAGAGQPQVINVDQLLAQAQAANDRLTALGLLQQAVTQAPNHLQARLELGRNCRKLGRMSEAIAAFEQACRCAPNDAEAHRSLGLLLLGQGQLERAEAHLRRTLALDPEDQEARRNLLVIERRWATGTASSTAQTHRQWRSFSKAKRRRQGSRHYQQRYIWLTLLILLALLAWVIQQRPPNPYFPSQPPGIKRP